MKTTLLGANGFGELSVAGAFVVELILTFIFVYTILGVTKDKEKQGKADNTEKKTQ